MKGKKFLISILCLILILSGSLFKVTKVSAELNTDYQQNVELNTTDFHELHFDTYIDYKNALQNDQLTIKEDGYTTTGGGYAVAVAVFIGGVLFSIAVDGVVIYATGYSPADWVAVGLAYKQCTHNSNKVFLLNKTNLNYICQSPGGGTRSL